MSVGENIRRLRKDAGLTQAELAQQLGVARSTVTQWECGWSMPRMSKLRLIANAFHTSYPVIVSEVPAALGPSQKRGTVPLVTLEDVSAMLSADAGGAGDAKSATDDRITVEYDADLLAKHAIEVPEAVLERHARALALLVEDASMNRVAPEGFAMVFDPAIKPANGQIAVLGTEDHGTLVRRWFRGSSTLMLVADSHSEQDDIVLPSDAPVDVFGTVVWIQSPHELA